MGHAFYLFVLGTFNGHDYTMTKRFSDRPLIEGEGEITRGEVPLIPELDENGRVVVGDAQVA